MSWWLILLAVIIALLTVALVLYFVVIFAAEDDENQAWLPKSVVVLSLSFACYNVLLLPYDIANVRESIYNPGGDINMIALWTVILVAIFVLCFLVCPFAMAYYESMDPDHTTIWQQVRPALIITAIIAILFLSLLFVCWGVAGHASISYAQYNSLPPSPNINGIQQFADSSHEATLHFRVSLVVYLVGLTCAIGWVLFFIFGGVGLAALPMDFIMLFRNRPRPITAAHYALRRAEIAQESQRLMDIGKEIEDKERLGHSGRKHREKVLSFKRQVHELEEYHNKIETSYREQGGKVIKGYVHLLLGIIFASMSIMWVLHMILHNMAHVHPFLNNMFRGLDSAFMLFGVLAYSCLSFYLLWCVVKGCIKIGGNLVLFQIYPMELNATLMNAFLFNSMLIMITSMAVVQFCAISFSEYAVNTNVTTMFTVYVANLQGIKYVVMYLQYPLPVIAALSIVWLLLCPKRCVNDD